MANERYGLLCPICNDCCYIGKTMGDGIYSNCDEDEQMRIIWTWMWKHLLECHKEFQFDAGDEALFHVVHEGHSAVQEGIQTEHHWNRHTDKEY